MVMTKTKQKLGILGYLIHVTDPRKQTAVEHKLIDILAIAICAVISGGDGWDDIEQYGKQKLQWLKTFLELPNGIPSHDTFARVFSLVDPEKFEACFYSWIKSLAIDPHNEI